MKRNRANSAVYFSLRLLLFVLTMPSGRTQFLSDNDSSEFPPMANQWINNTDELLSGLHLKICCLQVIKIIIIIIRFDYYSIITIFRMNFKASQRIESSTKCFWTHYCSKRNKYRNAGLASSRIQFYVIYIDYKRSYYCLVLNFSLNM